MAKLISYSEEARQRIKRGVDILARAVSVMCKQPAMRAPFSIFLGPYVRMLPNPHYEGALRALNGRDAPVVEFLHAQHEVQEMRAQVQQFLDYWLAAMARDHRSYVTVAIGCTGGQHRSVYLVEQLAQHFAGQWATLKRHRELDALAPKPH